MRAASSKVGLLALDCTAIQLFAQSRRNRPVQECLRAHLQAATDVKARPAGSSCKRSWESPNGNMDTLPLFGTRTGLWRQHRAQDVSESWRKKLSCRSPSPDAGRSLWGNRLQSLGARSQKISRKIRWTTASFHRSQAFLLMAGTVGSDRAHPAIDPRFALKYCLKHSRTAVNNCWGEMGR